MNVLVRQLDLYAHMISAETDMLKVTRNTEISRLLSLYQPTRKM